VTLTIYALTKQLHIIPLQFIGISNVKLTNWRCYLNVVPTNGCYLGIYIKLIW